MRPALRLYACVGMFATLAYAVTIPREVTDYTKLSEAQLKRLVTPIDTKHLHVRASNCSANDTLGGVYPAPTAPSAHDLLKRNAFVKR